MSARKRVAPKSSAVAFAPASIGNVSIGFDILGMAIAGVGDTVEVRPRTDRQVIIECIKGREGIDSTVRDLPLVANKNTAGAALLALQKGEKLSFGFDVSIHKGIPLGSGMGGSAASAVAAVVAASSLLRKKIPMERQLFYALEGEKMASGAAHPDNVAPCLYGGLTLASLSFHETVVKLPFPRSVGWMLVHPEVKVETKYARGILGQEVSLSGFVQQSAHLASFIAGLYKKDLAMLRQGFQDIIIEAQRAHLIPGFSEIKKKVLAKKGVLGFSISGSGPSVFALVESKATAQSVAKMVQKEFAGLGIHSQLYFGLGPSPGARILPSSKVEGGSR